MKRPAKIKYPYKPMSFEDANCPEYKHGFNVGFSKACEDYEKFLPSKKELVYILMKMHTDEDTWAWDLAKTISKRLKGDL